MVLEKQILMFLNIAHNSVKQCMSEVFQRGGFNLTPEQFLVMDTLWDEGVLTQQQIADITMRDKNSIVKLIDGLENRSLSAGSATLRTGGRTSSRSRHIHEKSRMP